MNLLPHIAFLAAGFILLMKGADYFVEGASMIAAKFGIPQIVIGLTIVACWTSAPEAAVSISAAFKGNVGITVGNILGSNIMNILLILGLTAVVSAVAIKEGTVKVEMPFVIVITVVLTAMGIAGGSLSRLDGVILWVLFIGFFVYLFRLTKKEGIEEEIEQVNASLLKMLGSDVTVDAATSIAKALNVSDRIIGLTVVAFGTSLPELVTSVTAAFKGKADIAVGNIVGSNIFNILFVVGTVAVIHPVPFDTSFIPDALAAILSAAVLWILSSKDRKLARGSGFVMLVLFAVYLAQLLIR